MASWDCQVNSVIDGRREGSRGAVGACPRLARTAVTAIVAWLATLFAVPAWAQTQPAADMPMHSMNAARLIDAWQARLAELAQRILASAASLDEWPDHAARALALLTDLQGLPVLYETLAVLAALLGFAGLLEWGLRRRTARFRQRIGAAASASWLQRAAALAVRLLLDLVGLAVFFAAVNAASFLFFERFDPRRELIVTVVLAITLTRLAAILSRFILSPDDRHLRLAALDCAMARGLHRCIIAFVAVASLGFLLGGLLGLLGVPREPLRVWEIGFGLLLTLMLVAWAWLNRRPVAAMIADVAGASELGTSLAAGWHVAATLYLAIAWCVWAINGLFDRMAQQTAIAGSVLLLMAVPLVDRLADGALGWVFRDRPEQPETRRQRLALFRRAMLGSIRAVLALLVALLAIEAWGIPILSLFETPLGRAALKAAFNISVALLLGYVAWEGSKLLMERYLGEPPAQPQGEDAKPGTRAHTLLPVLRNFTLIALCAVVGLIVLSSLGVDIAPLLAGAGIVGLAIGFGSQTLVRDVVSGFFFLLDDAFRIGEYVDVGRAKGVVERINIRSLQLRHHRGALHTVPYGQIQEIGNHTRDWVVEKLEFTLAYGTDVEKVRKIIKAIGLEIMEDAEIGPLILEPLKSQGVKEFADSGMIFQAKFKAVPGEQFTIRREAYRRMHDAFLANGIQLAVPTVNVGQQSSSEDAAAAAAAAPALKAIGKAAG